MYGGGVVGGFLTGFRGEAVLSRFDFGVISLLELRERFNISTYKCAQPGIKWVGYLRYKKIIFFSST